MSDQSIVIVGAGHSGAKAASALRKHGWTGGITLVGEEPIVPYDRPPLSKAVLLGRKNTEQCAFFPASWYTEKGIDLILGASVTAIDRQDCRIRFNNSAPLEYDRLLLATGSAVIPLSIPGAGLRGVWPLRTPHHADEVARVLQPGARVAIIGAGVIGLEVAAAAIERACSVRVFEAAPVAMGRSLPQIVSDPLVNEHRKRRVEFRFGVQVQALEGNGTVSALTLDTGETLPCDVVVYGVGARPRVELASAAGLSVENGIRTNSFLQTDDPRIFACGDVCRYASKLFDAELRLENWRNAEDQADVAARNMLGQRVPYDEVPWFWSNQFDLALQVAGLPAQSQITLAGQSGEARLFLSLTTKGMLQGAAGLGPLQAVASSIRKLKAAIKNRYVLPFDAVESDSLSVEDMIAHATRSD